LWLCGCVVVWLFFLLISSHFILITSQIYCGKIDEEQGD